MRKFATFFNTETFNIELLVKNEDGSVSSLVINYESSVSKYKYNLEEKEKIHKVNHTLAKNNLYTMTEEEMEHYIYPAGRLIGSGDGNELSEIEIQKLAGFTVEKKIVYDKPIESKEK